MIKRYYTKTTPQKSRKKLYMRLIGSLLIIGGLGMSMYVFLPIILWNIFLSPVFASDTLAVPIPQATLVTPSSIKSLLTTQLSSLNTNSNDATTWFPTAVHQATTTNVSSYTISIPQIHIQDAVVSTVDSDLGKHLINWSGTCVPPAKGNCVIFGHSTLPQLFDPKNYHTIFANAHTLQIGDLVYVNNQNIIYTYKIFSITIVDPTDVSVLAQTPDDSYLTLITCTPPGTLWKRLIIRSRLEKL